MELTKDVHPAAKAAHHPHPIVGLPLVGGPNGDVLDFAVFDAMGHGLVSSQLAHLAVSSYRHSRRSGLDLEATYLAMDDAVARTQGEEFVTCLLGRLNLLDGEPTWINAGPPCRCLCAAARWWGHGRVGETLPLGSDVLGRCVTEVAHAVLQPGDRLFCITDGVVDAHRPGGEDFGAKRLVALLRERSRAGLDAAETVRQLSHTVLNHHGVLSDDTTAFWSTSTRPRGWVRPTQALAEGVVPYGAEVGWTLFAHRRRAGVPMVTRGKGRAP